MNEAEIISHIAMRADNTWFLVQWWISTCFALIVASHLGTEHLTRMVTILVLTLFTLFSIQTAASMFTQGIYISAAYKDLEALASTSQVSHIAEVSLQNSRRDSASFPFTYIVILLSFISTVGFVIHRHLQYRKLKK